MRDDNETLIDGELVDVMNNTTKLIRPVGPNPLVLDYLSHKRDGTPANTLGNTVAVLERDPAWQGTCRWNAFTSRGEMHNTPVNPGISEFTDALCAEIRVWLECNYGIVVSNQTMNEALCLVVARNQYHPVREWFNQLKWDGVERVGSLFVDYMDAADTSLNRRLAECFMVASVARIYQPGCKMDTSVILVGAQGRYKSTSIKNLAVREEWYSDTHLDLSNKDMFEMIQGVWLYELAEFEQYRGRDQSRLKSAVSSSVDRYRRVWGTHTSIFYRQCVFVGSTNEEEILADPTGSRRWWPIRVGECDHERIKTDRYQLWAEAKDMLRRGKVWYLSREEARMLAHVGKGFSYSDPWEGYIIKYLATRIEFTSAQLLEECLKVEPEDMTHSMQMRVSGILRRMGWCSNPTHRNGISIRLWTNPHRLTPDDLP